MVEIFKEFQGVFNKDMLALLEDLGGVERCDFSENLKRFLS